MLHTMCLYFPLWLMNCIKVWKRILCHSLWRINFEYSKCPCLRIIYHTFPNASFQCLVQYMVCVYRIRSDSTNCLSVEIYWNDWNPPSFIECSVVPTLHSEHDLLYLVTYCVSAGRFDMHLAVWYGCLCNISILKWFKFVVEDIVVFPNHIVITKIKYIKHAVILFQNHPP